MAQRRPNGRCLLQVRPSISMIVRETQGYHKQIPVLEERPLIAMDAKKHIVRSCSTEHTSTRMQHYRIISDHPACRGEDFT